MMMDRVPSCGSFGGFARAVPPNQVSNLPLGRNLNLQHQLYRLLKMAIYDFDVTAMPE